MLPSTGIILFLSNISVFLWQTLHVACTPLLNHQSSFNRTCCYWVEYPGFAWMWGQNYLVEMAIQKPYIHLTTPLHHASHMHGPVDIFARVMSEVHTHKHIEIPRKMVHHTSNMHSGAGFLGVVYIFYFFIFYFAKPTPKGNPLQRGKRRNTGRVVHCVMSKVQRHSMNDESVIIEGCTFADFLLYFSSLSFFCNHTRSSSFCPQTVALGWKLQTAISTTKSSHIWKLKRGSTCGGWHTPCYGRVVGDRFEAKDCKRDSM